MARKIGALWQKKLNNRTYLMGEIEVIAGVKTKIAIFKNDHKKQGSNQPDWNIVLSGKKDEVKVEKVVDDI